MCVELIETTFPVRALLVEPGLSPPQWRRDDVIGPHAPGLAGLHEAAVLEDVEVLGEGRQRHPEWPGEFGDRCRSAAQPLENRTPRRIAQPLEDLSELRLMLVRHTP